MRRREANRRSTGLYVLQNLSARSINTAKSTDKTFPDTQGIDVALRGQRDNGVVRSEQGPGQYTLWEIAR